MVVVEHPQRFLRYRSLALDFEQLPEPLLLFGVEPTGFRLADRRRFGEGLADVGGDGLGRCGIDVAVDDFQNLAGKAQQAFDVVLFAVHRLLEDHHVPALRAQPPAAQVVGPFENEDAIARTGHHRLFLGIQTAVAAFGVTAVRAVDDGAAPQLRSPRRVLADSIDDRILAKVAAVLAVLAVQAGGHRARGDDEGLDDERPKDEGQDEGDDNGFDGVADAVGPGSVGHPVDGPKARRLVRSGSLGGRGLASVHRLRACHHGGDPMPGQYRALRTASNRRLAPWHIVGVRVDVVITLTIEGSSEFRRRGCGQLRVTTRRHPDHRQPRLRAVGQSRLGGGPAPSSRVGRADRDDSTDRGAGPCRDARAGGVRDRGLRARRRRGRWDDPRDRERCGTGYQPVFSRNKSPTDPDRARGNGKHPGEVPRPAAGGVVALAGAAGRA